MKKEKEMKKGAPDRPTSVQRSNGCFKFLGDLVNLGSNSVKSLGKFLNISAVFGASLKLCHLPEELDRPHRSSNVPEDIKGNPDGTIINLGLVEMGFDILEALRSGGLEFSHHCVHFGLGSKQPNEFVEELLVHMHDFLLQDKNKS